MLKYLICCYIARFESVGASPARLPGLPALRLFMLGWMHPSPDKCMARPCTREKNLLSHPGLPPLGPSRLFRVRQLAVATAEDHGCRLPPLRRQLALEQASGAFRRKDGLRQATRSRRKLVVTLLELARHVLVGAPCSIVPGVRRLVVECQAAKAGR